MNLKQRCHATGPMVLLMTIATLLFTACTKMNPKDAGLNTTVTAQDLVLKGSPGSSLKFDSHIPVQLQDYTDKIPPSSWMAHIPGKVRISHLTIPGTRQSARYDINVDQYQKLTIADQLTYGVRSLHIDIFSNANGLYVNTSGPSPIPLPDFFNICINFLKQNTQETILLTIDKGPATSTWAEDIEKFVMTQGQFFYRWPNYYQIASLSKIDWPALDDVRGKMVLLTTNGDFGMKSPARNLGNSLEGIPSVVPLGTSVNRATRIADPNIPAIAYYLHNSADGLSGVSYLFSSNDVAILQKNSIINGLEAAENHVNAASLCETTIGPANNFAALDPELNTLVEDILENSITGSGANPFLRLGIVAMDFITSYESELLYLTNFNPKTKLFKSAITSDGYNTYNSNSDGSLLDQPRYNSASQPGPITQASPVPTYPVVDPATGRLELFDLTKIDPSKWMSYLPNAVTLDRINIPGSHDALSWPDVDWRTLFAQCQSDDLNHQLADGVRDFDFRLYPGRTGDLVAYHGPVVYWDYPFSQRLNELADFLSKNPTETVIVRTSLDASKDGVFLTNSSYMIAINEFKRAHPRMLWRNQFYPKTTWPNLGELRGKILLVNNYDNTANPEYKGLGLIDQSVGNNNFYSGYYTLVDNLRRRQNFPIWVQGFWTITGAAEVQDVLPQKIVEISRQFQYAANSIPAANTLYLNGANYDGEERSLMLTPKFCSQTINPYLMDEAASAFVTRPGSKGQPVGPSEFICEGIVEMDFVYTNLCAGIYLSNFRNADYY